MSVSFSRSISSSWAERAAAAARGIGDREIVQAQGAGRLDHLAQAVLSVRRGGVGVQVALDVGQGQQRRQTVLGGRLDLAAVLAQLRLDPSQAERPVDLRLGAAGEARDAAEDAVLADLQPPTLARLRTAMLWALEPVK